MTIYGGGIIGKTFKDGNMPDYKITKTGDNEYKVEKEYYTFEERCIVCGSKYEIPEYARDTKCCCSSCLERYKENPKYYDDKRAEKESSGEGCGAIMSFGVLIFLGYAAFKLIQVIWTQIN